MTSRAFKAAQVGDPGARPARHRRILGPSLRVGGESRAMPDACETSRSDIVEDNKVSPPGVRPKQAVKPPRAGRFRRKPVLRLDYLLRVKKLITRRAVGPAAPEASRTPSPGSPGPILGCAELQRTSGASARGARSHVREAASPRVILHGVLDLIQDPGATRESLQSQTERAGGTADPGPTRLLTCPGLSQRSLWAGGPRRPGRSSRTAAIRAPLPAILAQCVGRSTGAATDRGFSLVPR